MSKKTPNLGGDVSDMFTGFNQGKITLSNIPENNSYGEPHNKNVVFGSTRLTLLTDDTGQPHQEVSVYDEYGKDHWREDVYRKFDEDFIKAARA